MKKKWRKWKNNSGEVNIGRVHKRKERGKKAREG